MRIGNAIYLDHNATTPIDDRVLSEMIPFLRDSFGNPHSSEHAFGWVANDAVEKAKGKVAKLIGCDTDEIVFTSGATEANNLAVLGFLTDGAYQGLVGCADHKSSLAAIRAANHRGIPTTLLTVDREGFIDLKILEGHVKQRLALVTLCFVNSEIGTVQDIAAISALVHTHGGLLHIDAAQAPCGIDVSDLAQYADFISLSAHKMYGPKGIGALFIRRELQSSVRPLIHGGGQQSGLRSGTLPTALCVGFGRAAEIVATEGESERLRCASLRDRFMDGLRSQSPEIVLNGPRGASRHPGNLNVRFPGLIGRDLLDVLQPRLAASSGSACSSGLPEPSHVLRALGLTSEEADSSLRFCVGRNTTEDDVDQAVGLLGEAQKRLA